MRIASIALLALFGSACANKPAVVGELDPPAGKSDSPASVGVRAWRIQSPANMQQLPEQDVATTDTAVFAIRGWDQIATAATPDGAATVRIVPRKGTHIPRKILTEEVGTRALFWQLTPESSGTPRSCGTTASSTPGAGCSTTCSRAESSTPR